MNREKSKNKSDENNIIRTCWNCNPAHEHLKTYKDKLYCLSCGNVYKQGDKIDEFVYLEKIEK